MSGWAQKGFPGPADEAPRQLCAGHGLLPAERLAQQHGAHRQQRRDHPVHPVLLSLRRQPGRGVQRLDDEALHGPVPGEQHPRRGGLVLLQRPLV